MIFDQYLEKLYTVGFVKIPNFFDKSICTDFLNGYKNILNLKKDKNLPGNENGGKNLKFDNGFYGKKDLFWELFKINIDERNVSRFTEKLNLLDLGSYKSAQLVVRKKFIENVLPCHVDNLYNPSISFFNCGIYLTNTSSDDRVFFVENTHNIATNSYIFEDKELDKTYLDAEIGDLIIHNSYTWHGSDNSDSEGRTTLYIKYEK